MSGLPDWFDDASERRRRNARSRSQERNRARETGGRETAGSGSSWRSPGDVRGDEHLEELKFTDSRSYTFRVDEWTDIKEKALRLGREPRMVVEFPQEGLRLIIEEG